jgi:S1-C subfamily serine protease
METAATLFDHAVGSVFQITSAEGWGTGFLVRSDGLILTNQHVVAGACRVHLQGHTGPPVAANVVMHDFQRDLAALHPLEPQVLEDATPLRIARSHDIRVGDEVIAIGNPARSAAFSLSKGYVSALSHALLQLPFLQLNLSINPGNSGGPIIGGCGNVLGMATLVTFGLDGQRIEGMCFAIPAGELAAFAARVPDLATGLAGCQCCAVCGHLVSRATYCSHCGVRLQDQEQPCAGPDSSVSQSPKEQCTVCGEPNLDRSIHCRSCGVRL